MLTLQDKLQKSGKSLSAESKDTIEFKEFVTQFEEYWEEYLEEFKAMMVDDDFAYLDTYGSTEPDTEWTSMSIS